MSGEGPTEGDVALACMRELVGALVALGLTDACVSPGSRSTPLALALARDRRVRVHVHLDERASGFFALGLAKATGRPAAVACTSGTAAAELLPAAVEAHMARVPLLLLTADRPPELRGVGANQTIEQVGLYGRYVRWSHDADVPGDRPDPGHWHGLALEAWGRSLRHPPGPVHLNLPFREPLVPSREARARGEVRLAFGEGPTGPPAPSEEDVRALLEVVGGTERGLVLAGSLRAPAAALLELAARVGWPVAAEPTSGLRLPGTLEAAQALFADAAFAAAHEPEVVLQVGAAPTSRPALGLVARAGRLVIVDPDDLVADPHRRAARRLVVDPEALCRAALRRAPARGETAWLRAWREADRRARSALDAMLDAWTEPSEPRVARDVAAWVPEGGTLVVASSMPVRDLDLAMRPRTGLRVLANRGASGIDGFVSTALGVAAAGSPTVALAGDLSLLHDVGSLLWRGRRGPDLVLVVPNNDGGAIFSMLPQRDLPELEPLFVTPHGLDLGAVCEAAGVGHALVLRAEDLPEALERARAAGGVQVVEVPVERAATVRHHAELRGAVGEALR
ncbi:2-succinyl-5-enolpyruvyl-6-hydroxy-3-cyclohexene-1-carboxylate synthase [bacterium HR12]|nr:2-succinyl-5-enolpyruvyl-6-hydroxy-3-cyclohexene-1-carboxylate synthase [bacterium HR12]